jgi:hypothetical protein
MLLLLGELKHEEKRCVEELQCNIVVTKRSQPKVLRLNLVGSPDKESKATGIISPVLNSSAGKMATAPWPGTVRPVQRRS